MADLPKPGVYDADQISEEQYHALPLLSSHALSLADPARNGSLAKFRACWGKRDSEATSAQRIGAFVDAALLRPATAGRFIARPTTYPSDPSKPWSGNSKECKAWIAEREADGAVVMSPDDHAEALALIAAFRSDRECQDRITNPRAIRQAVLIWRCPVSGLDCKAMIDLFTPDDWAGPSIDDMKTTREPLDKFIRSDVWRYGYDLQLAWYGWGAACLTGQEPASHGIIAVEKVEPYRCRRIPFAREAIEKARAEVLDLAQSIAAARLDDYWPDGLPSDLTLFRPEWVDRARARTQRAALIDPYGD